MADFVQSLIDGIPLPALVVGRDNRIFVANAGAVDLFGPTLSSRHFGIVLRQPALQEAISQCLADGQPRMTRLVLPTTQQELTYDARFAPVLDGGVICTFQDCTEIERAIQMRRDFVANVSHELRTPLTALIGFIETLKGPARDDPAARLRFLAIMEREAGRMNRLVRDLLHLSRVEAQERVRPRKPVDVGVTVSLAIAALRPMAEGMNVRIECHGDAGVPLPGDPDQLMQVFNNLIENAVKYGGADRLVTIRFSDEQSLTGPALRVDVTDEGEGIDPVHLPRLTERFYRADSHRSREQGGTGLGLAIVKHIVSRHRGWFRIDSFVGQGSTFSVILPRG